MPVGGTQTVVAGDDGWCIVTVCNCTDQPFYTRESDWYASEPEAAAALAAAIWDPP